MIRSTVVLLAALLLTAPLQAQEADSPDRRASYIQGAIRGTLTYLERSLEALVAGDTAAASAALRQARGRVRATETHVLIMRVLLRDTASFPPPPPPDTLPPEEPDTSAVEIRITPASGPFVLIGDTIRFGIIAVDSAGVERESEEIAIWESSDTTLATVNALGLATGVREGFVTISANLQFLRDSVLLDVRAPEPPPPPPPPPGEQWSRVLADTSIVGDVVVPQGEKWLIGANVSVQCNVLVQSATLGMRPGSSLTIIGATPEQYVGGGMRYDPAFANDCGIWVWGSGILDIRGTPKVGWNRTGTDPSWLPDDELWISPTAVGDFAPRRWFAGQPIPQVDPRLPAAEVLNVTRDIVITGPGHIHISSNQPSRIEYVTLRGMGILKPNIGTVAGPTTGRYALHFHVQGDGSRGTVVRGVAAINSGGRVYVPHSSHGITFEDVVSVNSMAEAFWWDDGDFTNDIVVDRLAASGVYTDRSVTGQTNRYNVVAMPFGTNMVMRNSVASGAAGGSLAIGFSWVGGARQPTHWETFEGNVAHNNNGPGIRFWNNSGQPHHIRDNVAYRNRYGLENGAYNNANRFTELLLIDNGVMQNASSRESDVDGGPARFANLHVEVGLGPAMEVGGRNAPSRTYAEFVDSEFHGSPKVFVQARSNPWLARFIRTNVLPEDIAWDTSEGRNDGSHVIIEHSDGRVWEIRVENSQVTVTGP